MLLASGLLYIQCFNPCTRDETICWYEADTLQLQDGVFEVHVQAVFSDDAHVDVSFCCAAEASQDYVATVALELWWCGALAWIGHCLCWWRRGRRQRRWW